MSVTVVAEVGSIVMQWRSCGGGAIGGSHRVVKQ